MQRPLSIGLLLTNRADERLLSGFLEDSGFTVVRGTSPTEHPEAWKEVCLVVADARAARRHGPALLALKWQLGSALLPVLVALPAEADGTPWLRAGFDDVLRLPIRKSDLLARLNTFLRLREQSERPYHAFLEHALIGIYRVSTDGRLRVANRALAGMLGYGSVEELATASGGPGSGPAYFAGLLARCAESGGRVIGRETEWERADGTRIWLREYAALVHDDEGREIGMEGTVEDVSARRRAEAAMKEHAEQLEQRNEELRQVAFVASHDLQEPLRVLSLYLQLLVRRHGDGLDPELKGYVGVAVAQAKRISWLIHGLLTYTRDSQRKDRFVPTRLESVLRQALHNLRHRLGDGEVAVTHDELPVVRGNREQLITLMENLIGNAVQFRDGSRPLRIHVGARRDRRGWCISVQDNGLGIEADHREQIFGMFRRGPHSPSDSGSGIGLALCKKIVNRHGGRIWVESEPGEGSTFYFVLPG